MKIFINPKYRSLSGALLAVISGECTPEKVYKENRNQVYSVSCGGTELVVKQFKVPNMFNRVTYSFFRKSKARRSYEHAEKLISLDVGTVEPVAYAEIRRGGLFHTGYFISTLIDLPLISDLETLDVATQNDIIRDFARFTVELHEKKVSHKDYNKGNIFYRKTEDGPYVFSLIDINRMKFHHPRKNEIVKCFTQMCFSRPVVMDIASRYAELRGWNQDILCGAILYKKGFDLRGKAKRAAKRVARVFTPNKNTRSEKP